MMCERDNKIDVIDEYCSRITRLSAMEGQKWLCVSGIVDRVLKGKSQNYLYSS